MIPALFHGRLLSGGSASGIVPPGFSSVTARATGSPATADAVLTINPDGTWSTSGTGAPPASGNWYVGGSSGVGAGYEVLISASGSGGSVTNGASSWVSLGSARTLRLSVSRYDYGTSEATRTVTVQIRATGGGIILSTGTLTIKATAVVPMPSYIVGLQNKQIYAAYGYNTPEVGVLADASISISRDGTWSVSGGTPAGPSSILPPVSGSWHVHGGSAESYDVAFEVVSQANMVRSTISNGASTWSPLSSSRTFRLYIQSTGMTASGYGDVDLRIKIRRRSTGEVVSETMVHLHVSSEYA